MFIPFLLISSLYIGCIAAQQDLRCGSALITGPTGWIASPNYPTNYPDSIQCEWRIQTEPGTIIEIDFNDFQIGDPFQDERAELRDYVSIFDTEDGSTRKYFDNPSAVFGVAYLSYSNMVIVQFVSDAQINDVGFNATYRSFDADSCNKFDLQQDPKIDVENTRCVGRTVGERYQICFVKCYDHYVLRKSSKITCQNGRFVPKNPCGFIAWEVYLCEYTNLMYCRYLASDLAEYWSERNHIRSKQADPSNLSETVDLDIFPDPEEFEPSISGFELLPGRVGGKPVQPQPVRPGGIETKCVDNLLKYSYCTRKRKKNKENEYAFSCLAFLKIKKLKKGAATRKMTACFQCRSTDCTSVTYI